MNKRIYAALLTAVILISCGKPKTVVILGNSITVHAPAASVGWTHNWGMAASARDSDYVHRLTDSIHAHDPSIIVKCLEIGDFERDYQHYNLNALDSLRGAYVLIMRIAENVDDKTAEKGKFMAYYNALLGHMDAKNVVLTDGFWENGYVNEAIYMYSVKKDLPFVKISGLAQDSSNSAYGKFVNPGVQMHPSDQGMRVISDRIWNMISPLF